METWTQSSRVALADGIDGYGSAPPFHPTERFPEYPFDEVSDNAAGNPTAYAGVRKALELLRLDEAHIGTGAWNPLRDILEPGQTVVLKPNFVRNFRETDPDHGDCLITHGAVIRAVVDYVHLALEGRGRIVIADAPQNDGDFDAIRRIAELDAIQRFYRERVGFDVEVYDLRPECARKQRGVIVGHKRLAGDPAGYVRVNLGERSTFAEISELCHMLYGSEYDTSELRRHQHDDVHEYLISKTVLDADVVIGLPKLKTHKKTGITVNLKNLVGINGNKNWLPHYREGTPSQGGDQFADDNLNHRVEQAVVTKFKKLFPRLGPIRPLVARPIKALGERLFGETDGGTIRSGNWYGNDTTWRMAHDLNRILFYADTHGVLHDRPVRRFLSIVDGVIAGQGSGPLDADPIDTGWVLAGRNPVAVDLACARLMAFDYRRVPLLYRAFDSHLLPLIAFEPGDVTIHTEAAPNGIPCDSDDVPARPFEPHFGWKGQIERSPGEAASKPAPVEVEH